MADRNVLRRFVRHDPVLSAETFVSLVTMLGVGVVLSTSLRQPAGAPDPTGPALLAVLVAGVVLPCLVVVNLITSAVGLIRSGFEPEADGFALVGHLIARGIELCLSFVALSAVGFGLFLASVSGDGPKEGGGILVALLFGAVVASLGIAAVVLLRAGTTAYRLAG